MIYGEIKLMKLNCKFFLVIVLISLSSVFCSCSFLKNDIKKKNVKSGLDVFLEGNYSNIEKKKIALFCDPNSLSSSGEHCIKKLSMTNLICSVCIIPIIEQTENNQKIVNNLSEQIKSFYPETEVFILNDTNTSVSPDVLKGIERLIVDIQLNGFGDDPLCSVLAQTLEAAKENNIPVTVLDRPNAISGLHSFGLLSEQKYIDKWTLYLPLPMLNGLTTGEIVNLFNSYYGIGCETEIVQMEGWKRLMSYKDTGLPINKNYSCEKLSFCVFNADLKDSLIYSALKPFEEMGYSIANGTQYQMTAFGSPSFNPQSFLNALSDKESLADFVFTEVEFIPTFGIFKNQKCKGIRIEAKSTEKINPTELMIKLLKTANRADSQQFSFQNISNAIKNEHLTHEILSPKTIQQILALISTEMISYYNLRTKSLIYKD